MYKNALTVILFWFLASLKNLKKSVILGIWRLHCVVGYTLVLCSNRLHRTTLPQPWRTRPWRWTPPKLLSTQGKTATDTTAQLRMVENVNLTYKLQPDAVLLSPVHFNPKPSMDKLLLFRHLNKKTAVVVKPRNYCKIIIIGA